MSKYAFAAAAALSALIASSAAMAADFKVTITVESGCTVTSAGSPVALSNLKVGTLTASGNNKIKVQCSKDATAAVTLTSFNADAAKNFRMKSKLGSEYINYGVTYGSTPVTSGTAFNKTGAATGGEDEFQVDVAVSVSKVPVAGDYEDTVTVTVEPYVAAPVTPPA